MDFRHLAACRRADPELFFPVTETGPGARQIEWAKAICNTCSVRDDCLAFALENGLTDGVFGGLAASERRNRVLAD